MLNSRPYIAISDKKKNRDFQFHHTKVLDTSKDLSNDNERISDGLTVLTFLLNLNFVEGKTFIDVRKVFVLQLKNEKSQLLNVPDVSIFLFKILQYSIHIAGKRFSVQITKVESTFPTET